MAAALAASAPLPEVLTVCIKYTPGFASRQRKLRALLASIRTHHGSALTIVVASEGAALAAPYRALEADGTVSRFLLLPSGAGLSEGRNALLRDVRTPYVALMDDDLLLPSNRSLLLLLDALRSQPEASVAGGCHVDLKRDGARDCFNMRFDVPAADGSVVRFRRARIDVPTDRCAVVHATHNFFVARTAVLQRLGWDLRQRVMEHETFFYQLFLNGIRVLTCPDALAEHDTRSGRDDDYERHSLRSTEGLKGKEPGNAYLQYLCKDFPEVRRFETPFTSWHCDTHTFCTPLWDAEFAWDGRHCAPFAWEAADDASTVLRPLLDAPQQVNDGTSRRTFSGGGGGGGTISSSSGAAAAPGPAAASRLQLPVVPLLVLVRTDPANSERRAWQRTTWLSFRWHALSERDGADGRSSGTGDAPVPWRYVYMMAAPSRRVAVAINRSLPRAPLGELVGDTVTLGSLKHAVRWALSRARFDNLLLTDDRSVVHIGRLWERLLSRAHVANLRLLAARGLERGALLSAGRRVLECWLSSTATAAIARCGGSLLLGHSAAAAIEANDQGDERTNRLDRSGVELSEIDFRRLGKSKRSSSNEGVLTAAFRGALLVDDVHGRLSAERSLAAFRWLMQAEGHLAVWQNPNAFGRDDCAGCEASYFAGGMTG